MKFLQIIEFEASQPDDVLELDRKWREATRGKRTATAVSITRDRDRPDTYLLIVEFPSYEEAMRNNDLPETARTGELLARLSHRPPEFRNLDVLAQPEL